MPKNVTGTVVLVRSGILRFASPPAACGGGTGVVVPGGVSVGCCAASEVAAVSGPATSPNKSARQTARQRRNALSISFIGSGLQGERGEIGRWSWRQRARESAQAFEAYGGPAIPFRSHPTRDLRAEKKPTCNAWALRGIAQL